jgi:hypothetical protein
MIQCPKSFAFSGAGLPVPRKSAKEGENLGYYMASGERFSGARSQQSVFHNPFIRSCDNYFDRIHTHTPASVVPQADGEHAEDAETAAEA